jgi:ATP-dependent Lon protease
VLPLRDIVVFPHMIAPLFVGRKKSILALEIVPVSRMDEVLARAMTRKPEPIEWDETTTTTAAAVPEEAPVEEEASTLTAH